jgi:Cytochrome c
MRRLNLAMGLFSVGLIVSACSSGSDTTGTGGSGGAAGHTGGTGGVSHTGGTGGGGGATHTGGVGGGAAGTGGSAGAGGVAGGGGAGAAGNGGVAGGGGGAGTNIGGHAGGGSNGGGTAGGAAAGAAGSAGGAAGGAAGSAGGAAGSAGGAAGGTVLTTQQMRGQYLVNSVLGCAGCHTPQGGAPLSGVDCFVKTAPATTGAAGAGGNGAAGAAGGNGGAGGAGVTPCLSSANLTNDATGLKNLTDQQIKDAFTKGMDPDETGKFLFAMMPYYQFGTLSSADADAIVAYLRTVPAASHTVQANTAPYNVQPSAPEWAAVDPTALPAAGSATGAANGKYLATLVCATCHTVTVSGANPLHIDATKAFQGGKLVNTTVSGTAKTVQTSNLTPDATGIMGWNATQVATAITTAKDNNAVAICGMRALANMTTADATDIGTYLLGIPPVANTITMTCQ